MFKPYVTAAVFTITVVPSLLQLAVPGLEAAWMRDPAAIAAGEWWRPVTALLVQDGGVFGTLANLAFLAVLGYVAERALGPRRWLTLYAAGAVAGESAGYLLHQPGAGNSVALCGLAAGLALLAGDRPARSLGAFYAVVSGVWLLAGLGTWGVVAMVVLTAAGFQLVVHRERLPQWLPVAVPVAAALVLAALGDLHGYALLAGIIVGWILKEAWPSTFRRTNPA
ncbi:rhomboid family intramembrane serine protease [Nonomuraea zeae]|uniref:rhomboid family intramembrane serine protease n=1 Tax=Nonomuraea zeae TaxID=1642303 RepID=UPI0014790148|nr:rhomboid family intramembrane serine protease [Nonomuraea zeae]